jgi:hypothetical protein
MMLARLMLARHSAKLFGLAILFQAFCNAQPEPEPPCGRDPVPEWPALGESATVKSWSRVDVGRDWKPPACTGWAEQGFTTLVTVAARFRLPADTAGGPDGLLRHIGAISELAGMRYWSTTHKQWLTLITDAWALTDLKSERRREAFTPAEMKPGTPLYFDQVDNLTGKGVFQIHVSEAAAERIVFGVQNVSPMKYLFLTVLHPGDMQSIYFLDRESEDVWRFYSMVRTGVNASSLVTANDSSAINRAVAFYRWMVGIPADQEPPAAR